MNEDLAPIAEELRPVIPRIDLDELGELARHYPQLDLRREAHRFCEHTRFQEPQRSLYRFGRWLENGKNYPPRGPAREPFDEAKIPGMVARYRRHVEADLAGAPLSESERQEATDEALAYFEAKLRRGSR